MDRSNSKSLKYDGVVVVVVVVVAVMQAVGIDLTSIIGHHRRWSSIAKQLHWRSDSNRRMATSYYWRS
jgi:hypothetical protein